MKLEQKQIIEDYAKIKLEIKLLEEKAELLNAQALEIIQEAGVEEIEISDLGKLSLGKRRTWTYTNEVKEMEKKLKEEKKLEEQLGRASYQEKSYIIFSKNKEE